ncbi:MAG: ATP-binding protein [Candidatus Krumholzibacteriia bacterium]
MSAQRLQERLRRRWERSDGPDRILLVQEELTAQAGSLPLVAVAATISPRERTALLRERGDLGSRPVPRPARLSELLQAVRRGEQGLAVLDAGDARLSGWPGARAVEGVAGWLVASVGAPGEPDLLVIAGHAAAATELPDLQRALAGLAGVAGAALLGRQSADHLRRELASVRGENTALLTLNRTHGHFLAMASHEFRTPLTAITAYTDALLERLDDSQFAHTTEFLQVIRSEAERLARMTDRMLDYSRLGYGRRLLDLQRVAVAPLVEASARALQHRVRQRRQTLSLDLPVDLPDIEADPDLVRQVVANLLSNAIKYTPEQGSIAVSAREDAATVRIEVSDDGPGIAPGELRSIFRQFYRTQDAATRAEGSGLGLAIVKHIVALHDGHVDVRSVLGRGSTFGVLLPKVPVHGRGATVLGESPAADGGLRQVVRLGLRMVAELLQSRVAVLAMLEPAGAHLVVQGALGLREVGARDLVLARTGLVAEALANGGVHDLRDLASVLPGQAGAATTTDGRGGMITPVELGGTRCGVLVVSRTPGGGDERTLLRILAGTLSSTLTTATRPDVGHHEMAALADALHALLRLRRSGVPTATPLALRLLGRAARRLGLGAAEVLQLQYVGALHDAGMVRVDGEIIGKSGRLSLDDRDVIDRHPEDGAELLAPLLPFAHMRELVRLHHEHMDGSGYPEGRRGPDIPLGARILLVVDAFFAMIAERPWREAMAPAAVVAELQRHAGTQFDPQVVDALVETLAAEGIVDPGESPGAGRADPERVSGPVGGP